MAWNKIKFFWYFFLTSLTATSTEAGFDVDNLFAMREDTFWKATGTGDQYITQDAGSGLVDNGDFETGAVSPWVLFTSGGAAATLTVSSASPYEGSYYGVLGITNPGTDVSHIQVYQQPFPVEVGMSYTVIFAGNAAASRTIQLKCHKHSDTSISLGLDETVSLTTTKTLKTYTFTATETAQDGRLTFYGGNDSNDVGLDVISIHETRDIECDYLALAGHNFASTGAAVSFEYSSDNFGSDINTAQAAFTPGNDKQLVKEFTSFKARWRRLLIAGTPSAAAQAAITTWGPKTTLDYASMPFDPEGQKINANVTVSQSGYIAGVHERFRERDIRLQLNTMTAFGDIHTDLKRWFDDHGQQLFFLGWETGEHDTEIWLVRNKDGIRNYPLTNGGLYRNSSIRLTGRVE